MRGHDPLHRAVPRLFIASVVVALLVTSGAPAALAVVAPPSNDGFASATVIGTLPYSDTQITTAATTESGEPNPCPAYPSYQSVWYAFTAPTTMILRASASKSALANNEVSPAIGVYHGSGLGGLTTDAYACQLTTPWPAAVVLVVSAGVTYYIQASDISPSVSDPAGITLDVAAQAPANDFFQFAQPLGGDLPLTVGNVNGTGATPGGNTDTFQPDEPEPSCRGSVMRTVWYALTASAPTTLTVTVTPSTLGGNSIHPVVAVYHGSGLGSLYEDGCASTLSTEPVSAGVAVTAGTTYYIQVGDAFWWEDSPTGFNLSIVDVNAPTATKPVAKLVSPQTLPTSGFPVTVTWAATSHGGAAIDHHNVELKTDDGSWVSQPDVTTSKWTKALRSGHAYQVRIRAVDSYDRVSGWATSGLIQPVAYQNTSAHIAWRGTWTTTKGSAWYGGSDRYSQRAGASATLTFTGRHVAWVTAVGPTRGKARVYVNGVYMKTIDLHAAGTTTRRVVWTRSWSSSSARTVRIVVVGTSGRPRVDVDAFLILR